MTIHMNNHAVLFWKINQKPLYNCVTENYLFCEEVVTSIAFWPISFR